MTVSDQAALPADQLADGLVVSAVASVQTVVVDWTTGGRVVRCHCKTETMKAQQSFQGNPMASVIIEIEIPLWTLDIGPTSMSDCDWSGLLTAPRQVCRLAPVVSNI